MMPVAGVQPPCFARKKLEKLCSSPCTAAALLVLSAAGLLEGPLPRPLPLPLPLPAVPVALLWVLLAAKGASG